MVQYATLSFSCDSNRASFETWGTNQSKNKRRKEKNALNLGTFFKQRARYCRVSRPRKPRSCAEWDEDTYFLLAKSRTKPGREREREKRRENKITRVLEEGMYNSKKNYAAFSCRGELNLTRPQTAGGNIGSMSSDWKEEAYAENGASRGIGYFASSWQRAPSRGCQSARQHKKVYAGDTVVTVEERPQFLTAHRGARITDSKLGGTWSGLSFYENDHRVIQAHYKKLTQLEKERRAIIEEERNQQRLEKQIRAAIQREKFREKCRHNREKQSKILRGRSSMTCENTMPLSHSTPFLVVSRIRFEKEQNFKRRLPKRSMSEATLTCKSMQQEMQALDDFENRLHHLKKTRPAFF